MKYFCQITRQSQRIFAALVLTSILCLGVGMARLETATTDSPERLEKENPANPSNEGASNMGDETLHKSVANAVLRVASEQLSLPISQLRITQAQQQTWRDRCLGLSQPTEKCISTLTPGWQVTVEGRQQFYIYRTDNSGSQVRTEAIADLPPHNDNLPYSVADAILREARSRLNLPTSGLRILQAERQTWSDACLGLASPGQVCTQALVPGWRVTVDGKTQILVYRTNDFGSLVRVEETASKLK
jgi:hypothetical protein